MPLIQQILLAIRTLTEDEPLQPRRNRHGHTNRQRSNSKRQQAVNLVITFRDLFASGGLNYLVDDDSVNRMNRSDRHNHTQQGKNSRNSPNHNDSELEYTKQCLVDLTEEGKCLPEESSTDLVRSENTVAILHEERIISSTELNLPVYIDSSRAPETRELEVFGRSKRRRTPVTVPLSSDDENKTVAALRKVLKWSPTKQSLATFAVTLPKEEEHKAVAVVQNAVNRVKEEQQKKKKRKFKFLKFTFC